MKQNLCAFFTLALCSMMITHSRLCGADNLDALRTAYRNIQIDYRDCKNSWLYYFRCRDCAAQRNAYINVADALREAIARSQEEIEQEV